MKLFISAVVSLMSYAASVDANATSFTITTETGDSLGFSDPDKRRERPL